MDQEINLASIRGLTSSTFSIMISRMIRHFATSVRGLYKILGLMAKHILQEISLNIQQSTFFSNG